MIVIKLKLNLWFILVWIMITDQGDVKFRYEFDPQSPNRLEKTKEQSGRYFFGSGGHSIGSVLDRVTWPQKKGQTKLEYNKVATEFYKQANLEFNKVVTEFYIDEFLGKKGNIVRDGFGGAFSGVYSENNQIRWQDSQTIIVIAHLSGTGKQAEFRSLPVVYKTWYDCGNFFLLSLLSSENDRYTRRIAWLSNSISNEIKIDEIRAYRMLSFESQHLVAVFLPLDIHNSQNVIRPRCYRLSKRNDNRESVLS